MIICNEYLTKASCLWCVGEMIAKKYVKEFGNIQILVINNSKKYQQLKPYPTCDKEIKLIHHGAAIRARKLELMIEMMNYLDDKYTLDLMLVPTQRDYLEELKSIVVTNKRIKIINPVEVDDISVFINKYDIGLFILVPNNFNYENALPNKFFEFIQARLAIAIAASKEMENIVNKYNLGVISDDFSPISLATKIRTIGVDKIMEYKNNCDTYAYELSANKNYELIKESVKMILKKS